MSKKLLEEIEMLLQGRINQILQNNEIQNHDKLPGLVEALKLIKEKSWK
ncbi:hypothetical protein J2S74_000907 [Evansella vedderi]|uniref:Uncharacterized protein n=1 Tax=Evansella vedderi TaxID=38282 RepID=A0ABT9ZRF0_9BACI|nr:hypothetical protein [Evansella vedderi]MDQ0253535.1 hypothetical protein [Evansella vedderi]